jgi:hypothetical protein
MATCHKPPSPLQSYIFFLKWKNETFIFSKIPHSVLNIDLLNEEKQSEVKREERHQEGLLRLLPQTRRLVE